MIKNRFLEIRLQKGYKFQKDFAEFLGLSQYQYNRYERNERQPGKGTYKFRGQLSPLFLFANILLTQC